MRHRTTRHTPIAVAAALALAALASVVRAGEPEPGTSFRLDAVRVLPCADAIAGLEGARIVGSNAGPTSGFVELAKLPPVVAAEWLTVKVSADQVCRWVKIESPAGVKLALSEIEFWSTSGKLDGSAFGTDPGDTGEANAPENAFDGDPASSYRAPTDHAYVGLDLGSASRAPAPHFKPPAAVLPGPTTVTIGVWPPGPTIRYTVDGSTPSRTHGAVYESPIEIAHSTSIAAVAYQEGRAGSRVVVCSYLVDQDTEPTTPTTTYHIGNSLTDTTKGALDAVGLSGGHHLVTYFKTIPGCSIIGNWKSPGQGFGYPDWWTNDYRDVLARGVDHLFLQPFPNPPGLYRDGEFGNRFIRLAREHNPDVQPWLYAQWVSYPGIAADGRVTAAYCDQIGGHSWDTQEPEAWVPPIPRANVRSWDDAMVNAMAYYKAILARWNAEPGRKPARLCPGGQALVRLKAAIAAGELPGVDDFGEFTFADGIHLKPGAAYLITCVHYACIFGESPENKVTWAMSGLSRGQAAVIQRIAWETVTAEPDTGVRLQTG